MASKPENKPLSWKPRRKADGIFCSPACGNGCKREDYERAVIKAFELSRSLGEGWKPRVWENLKWYWEAVNHSLHMSVTPHEYVASKTTYTADLCGHEQDAPHGQWLATASTPKKAVKAAREAALKDLRELASWLGMEVV